MKHALPLFALKLYLSSPFSLTLRNLVDDREMCGGFSDSLLPKFNAFFNLFSRLRSCC